MAVWPLTTGTPKPTVVLTDEEFDLSKRAILIKGADETQLDEGQVRASYDLRVGERYRDHRDETGYSLGDGETVTLKPGAAVIIETEEEVRFPLSALGQIAPKVTLLQHGISNTPSKIDPGYYGPLVISVFNHGRESVELARRQKFCALFVTDVMDGVTAYEGTSQSIPLGTRPRSWSQRSKGWLGGQKDWLNRNPSVGIVVATALALVAFFLR